MLFSELLWLEKIAFSQALVLVLVLVLVLELVKVKVLRPVQVVWTIPLLAYFTKQLPGLNRGNKENVTVRNKGPYINLGFPVIIPCIWDI